MGLDPLGVSKVRGWLLAMVYRVTQRHDNQIMFDGWETDGS